MVKVKICGITNLKDALMIAKLKPEALGFVFYKKSPRYIAPEKAREIINKLPQAIKKVGVFVNEKKQNIELLVEYLGLNAIQLHGDESAGFCEGLKNYRVIKALRIKNKNSLKDINRYPVWGFLFDRYRKNIFGGTGQRFKWGLIKDIKLDKKVIFLSGGIDARNVRSAIKLIKPDWVDASTSVETMPGKKDIKKVKKFLEAARG